MIFLFLPFFQICPVLPLTVHQGLALIDAGEAMKELGEVKDALDMEVKQNFIDPLQNLHDKDLKEIQVSKNKSITSDMWEIESIMEAIEQLGIIDTAAAYRISTCRH